MNEKNMKMESMINKICGISTVLTQYCKNYSTETEELSNIYALIECLDENIDQLAVEFIKFQENT